MPETYLYTSPGAGNIRPAGRIRPAKGFWPARQVLACRCCNPAQRPGNDRLILTFNYWTRMNSTDTSWRMGWGRVSGQPDNIAQLASAANSTVFACTSIAAYSSVANVHGPPGTYCGAVRAHFGLQYIDSKARWTNSVRIVALIFVS